MKVVVIGGYGVFGGRLVRLLLRDGRDVVVAGRRADAAAAFASEVETTSLVIDRDAELDALWAMKPDVVVDAAGPFHAYGEDPYRLARACIAHGVHYLDLCDDPAFCAGITTLDAAAKAQGVFVLSGTSSVPAISSAAVAAMTGKARQINAISTAILPGNRAPRGRSVVSSILAQCGMPFATTHAGEEVSIRSWSTPQVFDLGQGTTRKGWMIAVPDQHLFPTHFGAKTVTFHAGLELGIMNRALAAFSWLRAKLGLPVPQWLVTAVIWLADQLASFGTDTGGMVVVVTHRDADAWRCSTWRLRAEAGDGPFIPAVAARAILRNPGLIAFGARPALNAVPLAAIEDAMDDLDVTTDLKVTRPRVLFADFLGKDFAALPSQVQAGHAVVGPLRLQGQSRVTRGASLWARLLAATFGFPPAADTVPVTVIMTPQDGGELWERRFGDKRFWSFLKVKNGKMTERFAPFSFTLGLHVKDAQLFYPVKAGRLGFIPLPKWCLPLSIAREYADDGKFHFDVELRAPFTGALMVHYQGWLVPDP